MELRRQFQRGLSIISNERTKPRPVQDFNGGVGDALLVIHDQDAPALSALGFLFLLLFLRRSEIREELVRGLNVLRPNLQHQCHLPEAAITKARPFAPLRNDLSLLAVTKPHRGAIEPTE